MEEKIEPQHHKNWFDKSYKILMVIPIILVLFCLFYLFNFYSEHREIMYKDVSLSGGTTITINGDIDSQNLEYKLKEKYDDLSFRKLTDLRNGKAIAFIIETSSKPEIIKEDIESILGYKLNEDNSSIEFTGSVLSGSFYKQLVYALILSFILMSIVIFILFRTLIPSFAVIFAVFSDILFSLVLMNILGIKLSAAGIAAFLMLIGYAVDDNILLTTRAIRKREGTLNQRILGAFKTGIFMSFTALIAVAPALFLITGLPDSFKQIFLILAIGLFADILNTWLTNAGIIKWYCTKKGIN